MDEKTKALVERLINAATMHRKHPCEVYDMVALANEAAATIRAQAEENERLRSTVPLTPDELVEELAHCQRDLRAAEAERDALKCRLPHAGHGKPCSCCGEPCDGWTGNASKWALAFPDEYGTGKAAWHHVGCVMERMAELARIKSAEGCDVKKLAMQAGSWFDRKDLTLDQRENEVASLITAALAVGCTPLRAKYEAVVKAGNDVGKWLSAALDDPNVCAEMKADATAFLSALEPAREANDGK